MVSASFIFVTFYEGMKVVLRLHDESTEKFKYHVYSNEHRWLHDHERGDWRNLWARVCRCNPETLGLYISHVQYTWVKSTSRV